MHTEKKLSVSLRVALNKEKQEENFSMGKNTRKITRELRGLRLLLRSTLKHERTGSPLLIDLIMNRCAETAEQLWNELEWRLQFWLSHPTMNTLLNFVEDVYRLK
ncbi:hypothetical protein ATANTOWER_027211 [Ataeniobius toweri]|uniref:Uncharacterized protein n=1 Tax=Ataeniobius toweri TaxID=208326 RepID=A0ABU7B2D1_9TELE|nr:hypothetical protein [Ataeniobius toweri]